MIMLLLDIPTLLDDRPSGDEPDLLGLSRGGGLLPNDDEL